MLLFICPEKNRLQRFKITVFNLLASPTFSLEMQTRLRFALQHFVLKTICSQILNLIRGNCCCGLQPPLWLVSIPRQSM
jgi:hypothetical protein